MFRSCFALMMSSCQCRPLSSSAVGSPIIHSMQRFLRCGFASFILPSTCAALCATTACNCSLFIYPYGCAPTALGSHRGPTFRSSWAPKHWKKTQCLDVFGEFSTFSRACTFILLSQFLLFSSLLLSFPPLFLICPYHRKFDFQISFKHIFLDVSPDNVVCFPFLLSARSMQRFLRCMFKF